MKRLFYLLFGLVLLPALLYAQGSLSLKDINDNLTNNYFTKTASDARYATTTYGYSSAEVDILLAPKADKTYVNATDEAIIIDNDSQDVQIESNRVAITTKADTTYVNATDETIITDLDSAEAKINDLDIINDSQDVAINALNIDVDSAEVAINLLNIDNDSQDVTIEANKVGVASLEVGLQTHQNNPTGAHAATAISATWTNVQVSLDSIEAAIQGIVVGSGFATKAQTSEEVLVHNEATGAHSTLFANYAPRYWYPLNMIDGEYTGEVIIDSIETSMTAYTAVYYGSSGFANAKADADATLPAIGLILETGTGNKKVLIKGIVRNDAWDWTKGSTIYVSTATAGALTSTKPSASGNRVNVVGYALSSDEVFVFPSNIFWEL
jgi:hypothetical protein